MDNMFLGQIMAFAFNFSPKGWATCSGQVMSIAQNTALFSLLGTTFGGNGTQTFGLPDLRGRAMVGQGAGPGLTPVDMGQIAGVESVTLTTDNLPAHVHPITTQNIQTKVFVTTSGGGTNEPGKGESGIGAGGSFPAIFSDSATIGNSDFVGGVTTSVSGSTGVVGSSQAFGVRNPYLGMNVCIALQGIFPSRN